MSNKETNTLILLHLAVFLAGWTGIFGRLITLGGLPLVWYRIMVSVTVLAAVLCCFLRKHPGLKRIHEILFRLMAGSSNVVKKQDVAMQATPMDTFEAWMLA